MSFRRLEKTSIQEFLEGHAELLTGRVLDFGSGKQPYRSIVEDAGGTYVPYDRIDNPASVATTDVGDDKPLEKIHNWDAIVCTQVIQYVLYPQRLILDFTWALKPGGHLLLTGPTNWPIVEAEDRWRFTCEGVKQMMANLEATVSYRASFAHDGESFPIGWQAVGRKR